MKRFYSGLFNQPHAKADDLTQSQREAMVDLLHFCMSADEALSVMEDKLVTAESAHFNWEPHVLFEDFVLESLARARVAVQTAESRSHYLQDIARRLGTTDLRTHAVMLCQRVFAVDGNFAESERAVFREIKSAFGWPDTSPARAPV